MNPCQSIACSVTRERPLFPGEMRGNASPTLGMGSIFIYSFICKGINFISQSESDSNELASVATQLDIGLARIRLQISKSVLYNLRHTSNLKSPSSYLSNKLKNIKIKLKGEIHLMV